MSDINQENKIYTRPWGTYQTLKMSKCTQVKWIEVKPKSKLSLQKHFKRSEHWVVVEGSPTVTIDKTKKKLSQNDHIFIPIESIHRIENETDSKVIIVEVQIGSYLGEDDIERIEDIYGRT
ncbi:MAG: phosphomannose isomerase type II C-terminal cupin domain [Parachlamydiales bacterium]|nr:phosphomannose isomerase type II C-terminal cupin domain [Parachlamydiales bacterium]